MLRKNMYSKMSGMVLCEPIELYNILNQSTRFSRLTESNYLCLIDARTKTQYEESHIITAKRAKTDEEGNFMLPPCIEFECLKYCVVYDGVTDSVTGDGPAISCAGILENHSRHPIRILRGGYELFSAYYPFFRTQKIIYVPQELDEIQPYPVEILQGTLYMSDFWQARNPQIQKDLKIKAYVNTSERYDKFFIKGGSDKLFCIPVPYSGESDLFSFFPEVCEFIDLKRQNGLATLVFSCLGISCSSTIVMAYLIHLNKYSLQDAWSDVQKCKTNMRPNRGFVQQLSQWEEHILQDKITDISDPNF
nr:PREDICTED: serine/threonine/tyrosine-interacting-like protein 1 isoform X1 [Latimeria chalumnae]|eukprot:XP_005988680.2 PREDICTED: serine/threonine/tyrosine-interacting-like protein 1 isoform X1 [Latimeria chalumnae]